MSPEITVEDKNLVFNYLDGELRFRDNHRQHRKAHIFTSVAANLIRSLNMGAKRTSMEKAAVNALKNFLPEETAKIIVEAALTGKTGSKVTLVLKEDADTEEYNVTEIDIKDNPEE